MFPFYNIIILYYIWSTSYGVSQRLLLLILKIAFKLFVL